MGPKIWDLCDHIWLGKIKVKKYLIPLYNILTLFVHIFAVYEQGIFILADALKTIFKIPETVKGNADMRTCRWLVSITEGYKIDI